MKNLQEAHGPIDRWIVNSLIEATPETWSCANLTIKRVCTEFDEELFEYSIISPESHPEMVVATDDLQSGIHELNKVFVSYGKPWKLAVYRILLDSDGAWNYEASFEY